MVWTSIVFLGMHNFTNSTEILLKRVLASFTVPCVRHVISNCCKFKICIFVQPNIASGRFVWRVLKRKIDISCSVITNFRGYF